MRDICCAPKSTLNENITHTKVVFASLNLNYILSCMQICESNILLWFIKLLHSSIPSCQHDSFMRKKFEFFFFLCDYNFTSFFIPFGSFFFVKHFSFVFNLRIWKKQFLGDFSSRFFLSFPFFSLSLSLSISLYPTASWATEISVATLYAGKFVEVIVIHSFEATLASIRLIPEQWINLMP